MWPLTVRFDVVDYLFCGQKLKKRTVNGDWEGDLTSLIQINRAGGYSKLVISPNDEIYFEC